MARINDLGNDKVKKLVINLAIPSMLAQLVNVMYGIVDRIFIGNIPVVGEAALAGAGVCAPIVTLITSFAILIGIGGAPLLAMRLGEKDEQGAEAILANAFVMLLGLGAVLTAVFLIFKRPLLMTFGASDTTFMYADTYLTICISGSVFALLAAGLNQFIICQGFSTIAMLTVITGAEMNIILDPIFIFVFKMGVAGAAFATIISQAASCALALLFLFGKRAHVSITFRGYAPRIMRRIIIFGLSPFLIIATDSVIMIVLNTVLQYYGGAEKGDMLITCATIVFSYFQIISMPLSGITGGTQPILSFNYGARNTARIKEAQRVILFAGMIFVTVMFAISQILPQFFVLIFTRNTEYVRLSVWGIRVFTLAIIPMAIQYAVVDGFTAMGYARVAVSLSLFRKSIFMITTIVAPIFLGATGAFYSEPVADCCAGVVAGTTFLLLNNRLLKKREEMPLGQSLYS
ncbi:MAG: MATE family efflux transporter [Oscillospiraceae bacterium]